MSNNNCTNALPAIIICSGHVGAKITLLKHLIESVAGKNNKLINLQLCEWPRDKCTLHSDITGELAQFPPDG